jgi:hypothetical protein
MRILESLSPTIMVMRSLGKFETGIWLITAVAPAAVFAGMLRSLIRARERLVSLVTWPIETLFYS